ncbi:2Fe-2S iron-sulfur cluster-binding protein [Streptomyces sp. NPDC006551]|uniref:2Fe-2S iron-sulfur cluster-binding protein n=1 Tax=Streptomyces sp. NPDC006551 TaxID=3157178 RepID=UPI0033BCF28E
MSNEHDDLTGGWEPIPQSEGYDGDATAFVQLPPEFMLDGVPLEAPGHGYVPPMITPLTPLTPSAATDPAATDQWVVPQHADAAEPDPHATGQWSFTEAHEGHEGPGAHEGLGAHEVPGTHEVPGVDAGLTGQWRIPVAPDSSDDSGEYTASMLTQYANSAPATLPGGAPAPWAEAVSVPEPPEEAREPEFEAEPAPEPEPELGPEPVPEPEFQAESAPEPAFQAEPVPEPAFQAESAPEGAAEEAQTPAVSTGSSADSDEHPHTSYVLRVNGADRPVTDSWIGESLLYVLRERLGLAGAKDGCSQGECGACNVQVDGRLVASCLVPAATAAGSEVRTVEGLASDGEPSDVQRALAKCGAVQCGFCVPGMAMTVHDLLEGNHAPTELETRQALCGNLCRCSGYRGVLDAVREVVAEREASAAAEHAGETRIPHQIPHPHDGGMA